MNKTQKLLEEIKTEVSGLKIRVRRIETFLLGMPNAEDYIQTSEENPDELLEEAKKIVVKYDRASASLLQRRLMIGYARASRLIDELEETGIVGPADGSMPREVIKQKK